MISASFLGRLEGVRPRGQGRWAAKCPAHDDRMPSLSIKEGQRGILLKCFAGCAISEICNALGIEQRELFFDALDADPSRRQAAAQRRALRESGQRRRGRFVDACKMAERFLESRKSISISAWSNDRLGRELNLVADAYAILEKDPYAKR